jgi:hypothetical protein
MLGKKLQKNQEKKLKLFSNELIWYLSRVVLDDERELEQLQ